MVASEQHGKPNTIFSVGKLVKVLLFDRRYYWFFVGCWLVGEFVLSYAIIRFIPFTQIDYLAYIQQVALFRSGERDYSLIEGSTGPLVYPALHLYVYTILSYILPSPSISCYDSILPTSLGSSSGKIGPHPSHYDEEGCFISQQQIRAAQFVWMGVWMISCGLVAWVYWLAGSGTEEQEEKSRQDGETPTWHCFSTHIPQLILPFFTLSKRLRSVYVLRLFNDPLAMMILYASVVLFQLRRWRTGSLVFSLALGIKMNILLFVPGLAVLLVQYQGIKRAIGCLGLVALVQILLPLPFFLSTPHLAKSYFTSAFNFSRQFLYKWSVNWNFVGKATFEGHQLSKMLLGGHLAALVLFAWFRWSAVLPGGTSEVLRRAFATWDRPPVPQNGAGSRFHIAYTLFTSNLIGIIFARSLHYQFFSWYAHQLPLILWCGWIGTGKSRVGFMVGAAAYLAIFYGWNAYPPSKIASIGLLGAHLVLLLGTWLGKEVVGGGVGVCRSSEGLETKKSL